MALMAALLTKHSVVSTFKKTDVSFRSTLKEKELCYLELAGIFFQVMKSICLILPNY